MVHVPSGGNQIPVTDSIFWSILAVLQGSRLEATVAFSVTRSAWRGGTSSVKPPSPASLHTACFYHCEQNDAEWLNDFLFFSFFLKKTHYFLLEAASAARTWGTWASHHDSGACSAKSRLMIMSFRFSANCIGFIVWVYVRQLKLFSMTKHNLISKSKKILNIVGIYY